MGRSALQPARNFILHHRERGDKLLVGVGDAFRRPAASVRIAGVRGGHRLCRANF